ncbi:MAG: hypothetical protein LUD00_00955 [Prevotellaceae bacterium]|nr:hypothetical protein [Prevotellaceae bacterium]
MANRISFLFNSDRINIWRETVENLGMPQYIHLLINEKEKKMFIQTCDHDKDAFRLYYTRGKTGRKAQFHVIAKQLMKYLAGLCGADYYGPSIRFDGVLLEDGHTIYYNLLEYEIIEFDEEDEDESEE